MMNANSYIYILAKRDGEPNYMAYSTFEGAVGGAYDYLNEYTNLDPEDIEDRVNELNSNGYTENDDGYDLMIVEAPMFTK